MSRAEINGVLFCLLALFVWLNWRGPAATDRRHAEFPDPMARSVRYDAFDANPNFADGATLQRPVPGTVQFEASAWASRERERALLPRPGQAMDNPFPATDPAVLARGRATYTTFCVPCHGANGAGDGPVVRHGYPAPPSLTAGSAVDMDDVSVFRVVSQGGIDMPGYASQIAPADRWRAVAYLRTLQGRVASPPAVESRR